MTEIGPPFGPRMKTVIVPFDGPPVLIPCDGLWNWAGVETAMKRRDTQAKIFVSLEAEKTPTEFALIEVLAKCRGPESNDTCEICVLSICRN